MRASESLQQRSIRLTELTLRDLGSAPGEFVCAVRQKRREIGGAIKPGIHLGAAAIRLADDLKQILRRLQSKNRLGLDRISQDEKSRRNDC